MVAMMVFLFACFGPRPSRPRWQSKRPGTIGPHSPEPERMWRTVEQSFVVSRGMRTCSQGKKVLGEPLREDDRGEAVLRSDMPHRARRRGGQQMGRTPQWSIRHRVPPPSASTTRQKSRWSIGQPGGANRYAQRAGQTATQGLMILSPAASNGLTSRVATEKPRARAVAAI